MEAKASKIDRRLVEGPILPSLLRLTVPVVMAGFLSTAYIMVDFIWLGRYGARLGPDMSHVPLSAVTLTFIFYMITFAWSQVFASSTVALVSRAWGGDNKEAGRTVVAQALMFSGMSALIPVLIGALFPRQIMTMLGAVGPVVDQGAVYLRIVALGSIFHMLIMTIDSAFRGAGDMVTPMITAGMAILLNILLDPFLIFGWWIFPELGVAGAALATIIAMFFGFVLIFFCLTRKRSALAMEWNGIVRKFDLRIMKDILKIGLPRGGRLLINSASTMIVLAYVARFGDDPAYAMKVTAAIGIMVPLAIEFPNIISLSLSSAATTMVGQNLGAGHVSRAWRSALYTLGLTWIWCAACMTVFLLAPGPLFRIFTKDPDLVRIAIPIVSIVALGLMFTGATVALIGVFIGAGDTLPPLISAAIKLITFGLLLYLLPIRFGMGWNGIWWSIFGMGGVEAVFLTIWFSLGHWTRVKLESVEKNPGQTLCAD